MSFLAKTVFQGRGRLRPALRTYQTTNAISGYDHRAVGIARKPTRTLTAINRRYVTTEAGDDKSGHIRAGKNQGIFFFYNVYPLKLNSSFLTFVLRNLDSQIPQLKSQFQKLNKNIQSADPKSITNRALPSSIPVQVEEVVPRYREGGAFVKFSYDSEADVIEIERTLRKYLKENPIKPWFNPFSRVRTFLVRGRPWVEDLVRYPSTILKVEFIPSTPEAQAAELSQETLYSLFRKYGKLANIEPQPQGSKDLPKFALLKFMTVRHAIMAKNCMHGYRVNESEGGGALGTVLKLGYQQRIKAHWIKDWLFSHPRLVIPALAALVATLTVAVFDPIRTFFIKAHVTRTFHINDNKVYKWLRSQLMRANDLLSFKHQKVDDPGLAAIWEDRKDAIEQIRAWLIETADTFIVIQGPRGSGKKELVLDQALKDRISTRNPPLVIDCKPMQEARGDSATIAAAANEVGYRPVFSWMNSISSLVDLAAQGTIGTKTGFSETLDTQLAKIWQNTATALKEIALDSRGKDDKDANLSDDEYLEAHPERRPVVIIDNFLHKSQESGLVYDKIAEWAAGLTTANIAHVIFLTNDVSFSKSLSKALPDRVFRQIQLGDCTPEVAKRFVIKHLDADVDDDPVPKGEAKPPPPSQTREDLGELDECIEVLGGRLTDLEFLARRIKTGETPKKAVREIISQSASEILKMYILDLSPSAHPWTPSQAWLLIKSLASSPSLRYNELLLSDILKSSPSGASGDTILQSLEQAELITILSSPNGRPYAVRPGKPVYQAAFKRLVEDEVLRARLDLGILGELTKIETATIDKCEQELKLLGGLPGQPSEIRPRVKSLLGKIWTSQEKVEGFERESAVLKKVLGREF